MHDEQQQGAIMSNDMENKVRRFVSQANDIAERTGIPVAEVERALIYEAVKNESQVSLFLDFVFSVVSAAKQFIGEWTRRADQRHK